jgi:septum formation protein
MTSNGVVGCLPSHPVFVSDLDNGWVKPKLILASASPRRRMLLTALGAMFEARPSDVNEDPRPGETPTETQTRITVDKAQAAEMDRDATVIACDTTVLLDGEMLNKPANAAEAWDMLRRLRGRAHQVQSCLVVLRGEHTSVDLVTTEVQMRVYSDAEIEAYIATGDPFDKAGGYAAQHAQFRPVAEIRGCPLNVIGLPLCQLRARVAGLGDCGPVCERLYGRTCPDVGVPGNEHAINGQVQSHNL